MNVAALQPKVKAGDVSIESMAKNSHIPEQEKVAEVCRQFEAVLLRKILSEARKTVIHSSMDSGATGSEMYDDMINNQLADSISKSGTFGLARSLQAQFSRQVLPHATTPPAGAVTKATPTLTASKHRIHD